MITKLKTLKDLPIEKIIKEWLIEEKLSLGRMDIPLPKVTYGQLRRLLYLIRQQDKEEAIKWVKEDIALFKGRIGLITEMWMEERLNITKEDLK